MTARLPHFSLLVLAAALAYSGETSAPLLSPEAALAAFRHSPDLRVELVAAEPFVVDPVDMAFDEDGRLYVVEMIDYPLPTGAPRGRVKLLEDLDGDGRMDRATVFCDNLAWPTSVAVWKGGAYVAAAPSIMYFKDTDGDRVADVKEEAFTGFGKINVQALLNCIRWSQENAFVCASGGNGGKVRSLKRADLPERAMAGRDFLFTPDGNCETLTGGGQFGLSFDDFGRRFVCSNSNQARHVVIEERYLRRNPFLPVSSTVASIAADGDAGPVFRVSPIEAWRAKRTQMRLSGESPGLIEFGGQVGGYFTSATGITVYRGTALGPQYYGNLFIGEVANNLVHRKTLTPNGATFRAERVDKGCEFLASTDTAFRPVNFANGPDGALYICDMYRACIEHPESIPESVKKGMDLSSHGRGRIWRVTAKNAPKVPPPHLSTASATELVAALKRPDCWWRETAARLIFERQDKRAVGALHELATQNDALPASRGAALWALHGLDSLTESTLSAALADASPDVREQALRLAEMWAARFPQIKERVIDMDDAHPRVRFQRALTLGAFDDPRATAALARLISADPNDTIWLPTAILCSAGSRKVELLAAIAKDSGSFAYWLAFSIGARNDPAEIAAALGVTRAPKALLGLADGMSRKGARLLQAHPELREVFDAAAHVATDRTADSAARSEAIQLLAYGDSKIVLNALPKLILSDDNLDIQIRALRVLAGFDAPEISEKLLASWKTLAPSLRNEALSSWFNRPARLAELMSALEAKRVAPDDLAAAVRKRLRVQFKERAALLAEEHAPDRNVVIERYKPALSLPADAQRGLLVQQKNCSTCHRAAGAGHALGPDLETVAHRGADELLLHILDPNKEVAPQFALNTVVTTDGRTLEGVLVSQSDAAVTLKRPQDETLVILRSEIRSLFAGSRSPMPENLESAIDVQQMADLIAYIRSLAKK